MSKQIIAYRVHSDRLHDIELENRTLEDLRQILANNGYDVRQAQIKLTRNGKTEVYIGRLNLVKLEHLDCVEFKTKEIEFPCLERTAEQATEDTTATFQGPCCMCGCEESDTMQEKILSAIRSVCPDAEIRVIRVAK